MIFWVYIDSTTDGWAMYYDREGAQFTVAGLGAAYAVENIPIAGYDRVYVQIDNYGGGGSIDMQMKIH